MKPKHKPPKNERTTRLLENLRSEVIRLGLNTTEFLEQINAILHPNKVSFYTVNEWLHPKPRRPNPTIKAESAFAIKEWLALYKSNA